MCDTFYAPALRAVASRRAGLPGSLRNLVEDDDLLVQPRTIHHLRGYSIPLEKCA
ncbi:MAG: hypothetical protein ACOCZK_06765 [Planctomycetota bacterium]